MGSTYNTNTACRQPAARHIVKKASEMRQGGPSITAPLSRGAKRSRDGITSPAGAIICAVLSAILVFGGTIIVAMANTSSADNDAGGKRDVGSSPRGRTGALRSRSVVPDDGDRPPAAAERAKDSSDARGLTIHTHIGDIRVHFTPELAGASSIDYVKEVVRAASAKQNSGMAYNSAETTNGRRITEGFMCQRCKFYRAEKQLLLQGVIADGSVSPERKKVALGPCPDENYKPKLKCPSHDPNCGCHGPVMTRGMVGWAGGGGGPDFFINTFVSVVCTFCHEDFPRLSTCMALNYMVHLVQCGISENAIILEYQSIMQAKPVDWWENQHTVWGEIRDDESLKVVESTYELPAHNSGMRMLDQGIEFSLELF